MRPCFLQMHTYTLYINVTPLQKAQSARVTHVVARIYTHFFLGKDWSDQPECMHRMCLSPIKLYVQLRETSFNNVDMQP